MLADVAGGVTGAARAVALILAAFLLLPAEHRPVIEIEYLHSASHWYWQAAATIIALAILATRARRN